MCEIISEQEVLLPVFSPKMSSATAHRMLSECMEIAKLLWREEQEHQVLDELC